MTQASPEITVLSIGDPSKVSTWSNVPFFFAKHLGLEGCTVHYADIGPNRWIQGPYDLLISGLRRLGFRSEHQFFRSKLNSLLTDRRIKRVLAKHPNSLPVFMTYSFGARKLNRPYILFSDRTFSHHIQYFHDRAPNAFEAKSAAREATNMKGANMIVSLFPEMAKALEVDHGERVKYFGNVVNLPSNEALSSDQLAEKWDSKQILFIGKAHYKDGLIRLIEALNEINSTAKVPFHLNVIGLRKRDVSGLDTTQVSFHGYLNKANGIEYARYLKLLKGAFLFVNPNPRWASFSASCEALFMNTPLIIHPYPEFTQTFGTTESAWWYLPSEERDDLVNLIQNAASDRDAWMDKAQTAATAVAEFSWEAYVRKVLKEIALMQNGKQKPSAGVEKRVEA